MNVVELLEDIPVAQQGYFTAPKLRAAAFLGEKEFQRFNIDLVTRGLLEPVLAGEANGRRSPGELRWIAPV